MFSTQGILVAVECLNRFDNLTVPPEYLFRRAATAVHERIFLEQLALTEKHKDWFLRNDISVATNVDDHIPNLLRYREIKGKVAAPARVHFGVTENAENSLNNSLAAWQNPQDTLLWLDDSGSGYARISAIRGYHFDYVKIDKDFFWHLVCKESGHQLVGALVTSLSRNHHNMIIGEIGGEDHKKWLQGVEWLTIQGHYWQGASIEQLAADSITR